MKCELCVNEIKHYNLSSNGLYLCENCLALEDLVQKCKEGCPCDVKEEVEDDLKHTTKTFVFEDETTIQLCSDEKYDRHGELKRENEDLKKRLERLEALLLNN
jgi:hypothetical protein